MSFHHIAILSKANSSENVAYCQNVCQNGSFVISSCLYIDKHELHENFQK